jgi:hypothetical protein
MCSTKILYSLLLFHVCFSLRHVNPSFFKFKPKYWTRCKVYLDYCAPRVLTSNGPHCAGYGHHKNKTLEKETAHCHSLTKLGSTVDVYLIGTSHLLPIQIYTRSFWNAAILRPIYPLRVRPTRPHALPLTTVGFVALCKKWLIF